VELMITVVIVSILASIAIPSYTSYIQKSRRTEAKSALLNLASLEERFFSTNNSYTTATGNLGYAVGLVPPFPVGTYYQVSAFAVTAAAPPANANAVGVPATYTISVQPIPGSPQAADLLCNTFTITSAGLQTAGGTDPNPNVDCWK
jgi:type IV pilus assembly protein PilE